MLHKNSPKRIYFPGAVYYIVIKTKHNYPYFKEQIFCDLFMDTLRFCKLLKGFKMYGFSIIYDHVNLLIEPNNNFNIFQVIKSLKENVSRDINVIMGYTIGMSSSNVGETPTFRQRLRKALGLYQININNNPLNKKFDVNFYKDKFSSKYFNEKPYPKFRWKYSFFDHYIRFHEDHLKKQKDWPSPTEVGFGQRRLG